MATAYTGQGIDVTRDAGADLTDHQFRFVKLDANNNAVPCDSAGELAFGVLLNAAKLGEGAVIRVFGPTKVKAGGTITKGLVMTDANGAAVAATSTKKPAGIALDAAASNDVTTIHVAPGYVALP